MALSDVIPVGDVPSFVAASPSGTRLYVTNQRSNTVSVIGQCVGDRHRATDAVVATIPVGTTPWGVAVSPAGDHVYVSNTAEVPTGAPKENTLCP